MEKHTFTLKDRAGNRHEYVVAPHDPDSGFVLSCQLMAAVSPPILAACYELVRTGDAQTAFAVVVASLAANDDEHPPTPEALEKRAAILDKIQPERILPAIREALNSIAPELVRSILSRTTRDGNALSNAGYFQSAYTANYGELRAALWEVVDNNGFFSLLDILPAQTPG